MKKEQKLLALFLVLPLVVAMIICVSFSAGATAPTAACTVAVSETGAGTDYRVVADVTFQSESEFTAGIFAVEATGLTLDSCETKECVGGEAPVIYIAPEKNKVIFAGFSESTENDIRSYTKLILTLKFAVSGEIGGDISVAIKNISIANADEEKFTTADASGTLHVHTAGDWSSDADNHWHVCTDCTETFDLAAHTASDWITDKEATATEEGHRHKECTVCGRVLEEEDIETLSTHIPGDINNDGDVNNKDLTRLFQYLSEWEVTVNEDALDVNGDGDVNNKDLTRLFQYLSEWEVVIY